MNYLKTVICFGFAILLSYNINAQTKFIENSSTGFGPFNWGSDWWKPNVAHEKDYAEASVSIYYTENLHHPTYLNVFCQYSQQVGSVTLDVYISTDWQIILNDGNSNDSKYNHRNWRNGDTASFGHHVGQIEAPGWSEDPKLVSFNIDDWIQNNPPADDHRSDDYFILFKHDDYHGAVVRYGWLGPNKAISTPTKISKSKQEKKTNLKSFPNPAKNYTTLKYTLNKREPVTIKIYNQSGQLINTLLNDEMQRAGQHQIKWNGNDGSGNSADSGIYLIILETPSKSLQKKLVVTG
jgi:hypothetical protein